MNMYYIQYNIRPLSESEDFDSAAGAFLICFIQAKSEQDATNKVMAYITEIQWEVVGLEDGPVITHRQEYSDQEWLEAYDGAVKDGEFYALYTWSNDAHEEH